MYMYDQGEDVIFEARQEAVAVQCCRFGSPLPPQERLPGCGHFEDGGPSSRIWTWNFVVDHFTDGPTSAAI